MALRIRRVTLERCGGGRLRHCAGALRNAAIHPGRRFPRSFFSSVLLWRSRDYIACSITPTNPLATSEPLRTANLIIFSHETNM